MVLKLLGREIEIRAPAKTKTKARPAGRAMLRAQSALIKRPSEGTVFFLCMDRLKPGADTGFQEGSFEPAGSTRFHLDGLKGRVP